MLLLIYNLTINALILQFTRKVSCEIGALVFIVNSNVFKKGMIPWNKGIPQSDSAKEKNRLAHLGRPSYLKGKKLGFTPKFAFKKGNIPWSKGKKLSEELCKRLSLAHLGKMKGDKNPSWKGGITPIIQKIKRLTQYKVWFREILRRDRYTCRNCKIYSPPRITSHHLKSFAYLVTSLNIKTLEDAKHCKELWDLGNGVALCHLCHQLTPNYSYRAAKNPIDTNLYL